MDFELLYKDSMLLPLGATAVRVASIDRGDVVGPR
jgi:hypothetical protein